MTPDSSPLGPDEFKEWWKTTGEYELHQVLYWRWDPIGVANDYPYTADEYDEYPPQIVAALSRGVSDDELVTLLHGFEHDQMGLERRDGAERLREVTTLIRDQTPAGGQHWPIGGKPPAAYLIAS